MEARYSPAYRPPTFKVGTYEWAQRYLKWFPWTPEKGSLEAKLLRQIKAGKKVTSTGDPAKRNALTKLRRHCVIFNQGSRTQPNWVVVEPFDGGMMERACMTVLVVPRFGRFVYNPIRWSLEFRRERPRLGDEVLAYTIFLSKNENSPEVALRLACRRCIEDFT